MNIATLSALALSVAQCATPGKALPPDVASLVDAERSFAHASLDSGVRAAFLRYLADDAVVFRPEPVPAKTWYTKRPATPAILVWEPEYADVSTSNDLGFTTGPWAFRADTTAAPSGFGHYVSVWRRGADREWEVAMDVGIAHASVGRPQSVAMPTIEKPKDAITAQEAHAAVLQEESDFNDAASRGVEDAFDAFASDDLRLFRAGDLPALGKEKARVLLMKQPGTRHMQMTSAEVSRDGDLGFTYGKCDVTDGADTTTSYYLRIWRRMPDGTWKIVLDLDSPVPAGE